MNIKLMKWAAAGALSCCITTSALAGSVTQPGETVGLAVGAPLPQGLYFVNTGDWGNRSGVDTSVGVDIPVLAWSTPWTFLGARVQFLLAGPVVERERRPRGRELTLVPDQHSGGGYDRDHHGPGEHSAHSRQDDEASEHARPGKESLSALHAT